MPSPRPAGRVKWSGTKDASTAAEVMEGGGRRERPGMDAGTRHRAVFSTALNWALWWQNSQRHGFLHRAAVKPVSTEHPARLFTPGKATTGAVTGWHGECQGSVLWWSDRRGAVAEVMSVKGV